MYECPKDCLSCANSFSEPAKNENEPKSNNVQINISVPAEWKEQLENLARIYSVEEGTTITFLDLMRRGIQEKYQLGETTDER